MCFRVALTRPLAVAAACEVWKCPISFRAPQPRNCGHIKRSNGTLTMADLMFLGLLHGLSRVKRHFRRSLYKMPEQDRAGLGVESFLVVQWFPGAKQFLSSIRAL